MFLATFWVYIVFVAQAHCSVDVVGAGVGQEVRYRQVARKYESKSLKRFQDKCT